MTTEGTIYNDAYRRLIAKLRLQRTATGITQHQAANSIGMSRCWLSSVERCCIKPDLVQFCHICEAYKLDPSVLISRLAKELSNEKEKA